MSLNMSSNCQCHTVAKPKTVVKQCKTHHHGLLFWGAVLAFCVTGSCGLPMLDRFTYEVAPVFVLLEYVTLKKMREIIGWQDGRGDGIFSPGECHVTWRLWLASLRPLSRPPTYIPTPASAPLPYPPLHPPPTYFLILMERSVRLSFTLHHLSLHFDQWGQHSWETYLIIYEPQAYPFLGLN